MFRVDWSDFTDEQRSYILDSVSKGCTYDARKEFVNAMIKLQSEIKEKQNANR